MRKLDFLKANECKKKSNFGYDKSNFRYDNVGG